MAIQIPEWVLAQVNGAVPDLDGIPRQFPSSTGRCDSPDVTGRPDPLGSGEKTLPEIVIYEHIDFGGAHERTNLNWYYVGDWWNDRISSLVVVRGRWRVYEHWHYTGMYWDLEEGYYRWVEAEGIPNDVISSFKFIGW